jgi:hypothetical protein
MPRPPSDFGKQTISQAALGGKTVFYEPPKTVFSIFVNLLNDCFMNLESAKMEGW